MRKLIGFVKAYGIATTALLLPLVASAQLPTAPVTLPTNTLTTGTITQTLCNTIGWVFFGFVVLAIIMILVAAFKYLTAAGDPEKVKSASHTLLYAAIAILVAIIARALPGLIGSFTGLQTGSGFAAC
jgi:hypothetical protein